MFKILKCLLQTTLFIEKCSSSYLVFWIYYIELIDRHRLYDKCIGNVYTINRLK